MRSSPRRELLARLNKITGGSIPDDRIDKFPSISLSVFADPDLLQAFFAAMEWVLAESKR